MLVVFFLLFAGIGILAMVKKHSSSVTERPPKSEVPACAMEEPMTSSSLPLRPVLDQALDSALPQVDRIHQLFTTKETKLPIVETVVYTSKAPWLKGRPAWLSDYAVYYSTSKHFISRGLHGGSNYLSQQVAEGNRFNVFRRDKSIEFHLVADLSRLQMAFYYVDLGERERVLLKVYPIGAGRIDPSRSSGFLTPLGCYQLGDKISLY
ncbi:MAG: L,D-transpeptidase, partial [Chlamydiae bacterium]|nr:L,D-transpeptidase [Chlamydiota bacterium]